MLQMRYYNVKKWRELIEMLELWLYRDGRMDVQAKVRVELPHI